MEQTIIHLERKIIVLEYEELGESIDIDELTKIHYWNLPGETITISTLLNKVGIMKSQAEAEYNEAKFDLDIYEANLRKTIRKEGAREGGKVKVETHLIKLTEKFLDEVILLDEGYQQMKFQMISKQKTLGIVDALFWATNSKSKKLEVLMKGIKPEEFENEIIEEYINGMMIKKFDKKLS